MKAATIAGIGLAAFVGTLMLAAGGKPRPVPAPEAPVVATARQDALACNTIGLLMLASASRQAAEELVSRRDCLPVTKGGRYVVTQWGIDAVRLRPEQGFFELWAPRGAVE